MVGLETAAHEVAQMNALVTGASSGIGWEIAQLLSQRGYHVVLVARREERLQELAQRLDYGATVLARDLAVPGAAQELFMTCQELDLPIEVLVNNAGFGRIQNHCDLDLESLEEMNQLNVVALASLSNLFGQAMRERGHGSILNVGSMASYLPVPAFSNYAASKAFVRSHTLSLRQELRRHGVQVCLLTPGSTRSEFGMVAGDGGYIATSDFGISDTREVAQAGLEALFADRAQVIPGTINKLLYWGVWLAPESLVIRLAGIWRRRRMDQG